MHQTLFDARDRMGNQLSEFSAHMLYEGLSTLKLRCRQHMANGLKVAEYLREHPMIEKLIYPGDLHGR